MRALIEKSAAEIEYLNRLRAALVKAQAAAAELQPECERAALQRFACGLSRGSATRFRELTGNAGAWKRSVMGR